MDEDTEQEPAATAPKIADRFYQPMTADVLAELMIYKSILDEEIDRCKRVIAYTVANGTPLRGIK